MMHAASKPDFSQFDPHDPYGFDTLFDFTADRIYAFALRLTGDAGIAREVTTAAYQRALVAFAASQGAGDTATARLYRAAYEEIGRLRRWQAVRALFGKPLTFQGSVQGFIRGDAHNQPLVEAVGTLNRADLDLLILRFGEDLSSAEVAYVLHSSLDRVYSRLRRVLTGLLRRLYPDYEFSFHPGSPGDDLLRWGERLDAVQAGDEAIDLADRLRFARTWSKGLPPAERAAIRADLATLAQHRWRATLRANRRPAIVWSIIGVLAVAGLWYVYRPTGAAAPGSMAPTATPQATPFLSNASPQGQRLAFLFAPPDPATGEYQQYPDVVSIYTANLDGSGLFRVGTLEKSRRSLSLVSVSPDGRTLLYSVGIITGTSPVSSLGERKELRRIRLDGSGDALVADRFVVQSLRWSADGQWIAYIGDEDGWPVLYQSRPDGSDRRRLSDPERAPYQVLGIDRQAAVYWVRCTPYAGLADLSLTDTRTCALWASTPTGSSRSIDLAGLNPLAARIVFSPDMQRMAVNRFLCDHSDGYLGNCPELIVSQLDGSQAIQQTWEYPSGFDWSPDGTRLQVAVAEGPEKMSRFLWSPDLGTVARLPEELQTNNTPALGQWSPDGRMILYDSESWLAPRYLDLATREVKEALSTLKPANFDWYFTWNVLWIPGTE